MELTTSEPTKSLVNPQAWGGENASRKDFVLPKIVIAQASSDVCKEGSAHPGEIIHSQTKEVLAKKGEKLALLPIAVGGRWQVTTPKPVGGGFADFIRVEPLTQANDSDRWQIDGFDTDGKPIVHHKVLSFLVLPVTKIAGFPFFMEFRSGNKDAAKLISTIMQENNFQGRPAPARVIELSTRLKQYKSNSWFVTSVTVSRNASDDEIAKCRYWYDLFVGAQLKDASDANEEGAPF